jgi:hypothetical protein
MATPITIGNVGNVQGQDQASIIRELGKARQGIADAFTGAGNTVEGYADDRRASEDAQLALALQNAQTPEQQQEVLSIAEARNAFYDPAAARKEVTRLEDQSFQRDDQAIQNRKAAEEAFLFAQGQPLKAAEAANNLAKATNTGTGIERKTQALANQPAFEQAELELANMPPGPERTARIAELRTELGGLKGANNKQVTDTLGQFNAGNLANTPIDIAQYTNLPKVDFGSILQADGKAPTVSAIATYENKLTKAIKKDNRFATDAEITDKVAEVLSTVPGYVESKRAAAANRAAADKVTKVLIDSPAKIAQQKEDFANSIIDNSEVATISQKLQKNFPQSFASDAISENDLKRSTREILTNARSEYAADLTSGKITEQQLVEGIYSMMSSSSIKSAWAYFDGNALIGPKGTEPFNGIGANIPLRKLVEQGLRTALDEFLPNGARHKRKSEAQIKADNKKFGEIELAQNQQNGQEASDLLSKSGINVVPDKDGNVNLTGSQLLKMLNPFN